VAAQRTCPCRRVKSCIPQGRMKYRVTPRLRMQILSSRHQIDNGDSQAYHVGGSSSQWSNSLVQRRRLVLLNSFAVITRSVSPTTLDIFGQGYERRFPTPQRKAMHIWHLSTLSLPKTMGLVLELLVSVVPGTVRLFRLSDKVNAVGQGWWDEKAREPWPMGLPGLRPTPGDCDSSA